MTTMTTGSLPSVGNSAFSVVLIGAGDINFGTVEGPWNHSARLETLLGPRLRVLSVIDPDIKRSDARIACKRGNSEHGALAPCWAATKAHTSLDTAAQDLGQTRIDLVIVGCPPQFRGTLVAGHDTETAVLFALPSTRGLFIEKPVAAIDPSMPLTNAGSHDVAARLKEWVMECPHRIVSVGYMFRYMAAVRKIREIIEEHRLVPRLINARYFMAYASTSKVSWWSKEASGGPIVEQATHLVDLIRYFAAGKNASTNPVLMDTIQAATVEHSEEAGRLNAIPIDESKIAQHDRIPRATAAFWRHKQGTIATLTHSVALHNDSYHAELELIADGWLIQLLGVYTGKPTLVVCGPEAANKERTTFEDDPFETELAAMIDAIDTHCSTGILSSFSDALQTYELTWAIRRAGEKSAAIRIV